MIRVMIGMAIGCWALGYVAFLFERDIPMILFIGCGLAMVAIITQELKYRKRYREGTDQ